MLSYKLTLVNSGLCVWGGGLREYMFRKHLLSAAELWELTKLIVMLRQPVFVGSDSERCMKIELPYGSKHSDVSPPLIVCMLNNLASQTV